MTGDVAVWNRLAALLPDAEAQDVRDCWDIGEQEAGLELLVSGLLTQQVAVSGTTRAEISVLTEAWGMREALATRLLHCRADGRPARLELIEPAGAARRSEEDPTGLVLVPWILCTYCGEVLTRGHLREDWGDLSYLAERYLIVAPDRTTVVRSFDADAAEEGLTALLGGCR